MKTKIRGPALLVAALALAAAVLATGALAENVDPGDDGSQYAYGENVGWINAEPANCTDCGVEVADTELTGWMWGENIGWISMNCSNNSTCGTVSYGVTNDGAGNLGGYAWSENAGWISFSCANQSSCGAVDYGVTVNSATGEFAGYAWAENAGWVSFSCGNTSSCGAVDYGVRTAWTEGAGDKDLDGCTNAAENQAGAGSQFSGGLRNPKYFWDFYDVWTHPIGDSIGWERDKVVTIVDILGVASRFGANDSGPGTFDRNSDPLTTPNPATGTPRERYHPSYDRGPIIGANNWDVAPADGTINLPDDILGTARQFGHNCL